ncbi:MAG TPA: hydrolase [Thermoanaerobaculia bacterium]|nr:hydrolase [Thermoanaerobaculia bacterium]
MNRLDRNSALLLIIDVQEKLMPVIDQHDEITRNIDRMIRGCRILGVPAMITEQYVKGLGSTIEPVRSALESSYKPVEKNCFSAQGLAEFESALRQSGRRQILVTGIETHVCVYQTVSDLLRAGYEVTLIADALSSRTQQNKNIALRRMESDGAKISSTEMALFELTKVSATDEFRAISKLVK